MNLGSLPALLRSPLGRRVFGLFLLCSLLPSTLYSIYSEQHLRQELLRQVKRRMENEAAGAGFRILDRIQSIESQLERLAERLADVSVESTPEILVHSPAPFQDLWIQEGAQILCGTIDVEEALPLNAEHQEHLQGGKSLLLANVTHGKGTGRLHLLRKVDPKGSARVLVAELTGAAFFNVESEALTSGLLAVFSGGELLFRSEENVPVHLNGLRDSSQSDLDSLSWEALDGESYLGTSWTLSLGYHYRVPDLTVVIGSPLDTALEPVRAIRRTYIQLALITVLVVTLLSIQQIHRQLGPLRELCRATTQLAQGELSSRIDLDTGDEFEQLARDFNAMATHLERQFEALNTSGAINEALLGSLDGRSIIPTIIGQVPIVCPEAKVRLLEFIRADRPLGTIHGAYGGDGEPAVDHGSITTRAHAFLSAQVEPWIIIEEPTRFVVDGLSLTCEQSAQVLFPMVSKGRPIGVLSVEGVEMDEDIMRRLRNVAEHGLIALEHAMLVTQLDRMSWGTLRTLARTVDAKSRWTGGHSERVAQLAFSLAHALSLSSEDQERIYRGGLLHDIGKIGTPIEVLDKPDSLTPEEIQIIQNHTVHGEQILQPIEAFQSILPIVRSHHERWDGNGYPDRLKGTLIPYDARILAVADCFDALTTDRPYRRGIDHPQALDIILEQAGTQFDPECARAFWTLMTKHPELLSVGPSTDQG